jgi:putative colanic acid biosynthesis acetyltransferase WcaF
VRLVESNHTRSFFGLFLRFLWSCCSWLVFALPGRQLSPLRIVALRLFGASVGKGVLICSGVHVWIPWNLTIGDSSVIGRRVEIYNHRNVCIGSNTVLSQYTYICTGSHDYTSPSMDFVSSPVWIGSCCWIAAQSTVLPGVSIGDGCVVGAKSLVTTSLPSWVVAFGVPAKVYSDRILVQ